jgi:hypothetical protein
MPEDSRLGTHQLLDDIALAYHRAVAVRLRRDPEAALGVARRNLARWLSGGAFDGAGAAALREWESLLDGSGVGRLIECITAETEEGQRLRSSSPFVGAIPEEARLEIIAACVGAGG